ncbi:MAG: hypothetical protein AAGG01_11420 [Planctomycetota bacterium]
MIAPVVLTRFHAWLDAQLNSSPFLWTTLILSTAALSYALLARRMQQVDVPPLVMDEWTKRPLPIY